MLRDAYLKGMRDQRRSLSIWVASIVAYVLMMCALFPSVRRSAPDMEAYIKNMPEALRHAFMGESTDYGSATTYLNGELFSFMSPLFVMIFGIGLAVGQIAGEEENGTLSLLLAYPVSRGRLLLQKLGVLATGVAALCAAHLAAVAVGDALVGLDLSLGRTLGAHVSLLLLGLSVATVAFAVGAATGRRGVAIAAGAAIGAVAYLLNIIARMVESLGWLRDVSLFHYYGGAEPLRLGLRPAYAAVLLAVTVGAALVAWFSFERRDVHV